MADARANTVDDAEADTETVSEVDTKADTKAISEVNIEAVTESNAESNTEVNTRADIDAIPKTNAEAVFEVEAKAYTETDSGTNTSADIVADGGNNNPSTVANANGMAEATAGTNSRTDITDHFKALVEARARSHIAAGSGGHTHADVRAVAEIEAQTCAGALAGANVGGPCGGSIAAEWSAKLPHAGPIISTDLTGGIQRDSRPRIRRCSDSYYHPAAVSDVSSYPDGNVRQRCR